MSETVMRICLISAVVSFCCVADNAAIGTETADEQVSSIESETLTDIPLSALPVHSEHLDRLLSIGEISFRYGSRELLGRDEPDLVSNRRRTLAAETRFQLKYAYRSRTRWHVEEEDGQRSLIIRVWYDTIETTFSHDVWFLEKPPMEEFWDDRLVRHELDHIRISTNPAIEKGFKERVREDNKIVEPIGKSTEVTESMVRGIVKRHVQSIFDETIDMVRTRYRDLDQLTNHGLRPIPIDSEPLKWMKLEDTPAAE